MSPAQNDPQYFTIDMEPLGRRVKVKSDQSILEAARQTGVGIVSLCGGEGWCESCVIRVEKGSCKPPTEAETLAFTDQMLAEGYRLACQVIPESDLKIYIPPDSLSTPQRLQIEGQEAGIPLDPLVKAVDIELAPPSLSDLDSDTERLRKSLAEAGIRQAFIDFPLLNICSDILREQNWKIRAVLRGNEVVAILPYGSDLFGFAVDIGTTKLAAYLVDLATGNTVGKTGAMNPQIAYGEDVISRIAASRESDEKRKMLQSSLVDALNDMLDALSMHAQIQKGQIVQALVVGNTAMHHLFAGLPVDQLAMAPYVPSVGEAIALRASQVGLKMAPGGYIQLLPNIAGYVGADHVAAILATEIWKAEVPTMVIDIGTNTEISLAVNGQLYCCSCASGPAFEGAHIRDGMRAAEGAIESFQIIDNQVYFYTIGDQPPIGICGSGILDVVAELYKAGILDSRGAFQFTHPQVRPSNGGNEFLLVENENAGHKKDITISRRDINEIQLAKAAIRTGIDILLESAQIQANDLQKVIIAGAFGTYIRLESAIQIGMLPDLPADRYEQVGNAAGMGAKQALISSEILSIAEKIVSKMHYIELTIHPDFQEKFIKAMYL